MQFCPRKEAAMKNVAVIIPSLNPDEKLIKTVDSLIEYGFEDIILVNDGSDSEHMEPFNRVKAYEQCTFLSHEVNRGKGRALKTAFEFCIKERKDIDGVVTVDGDGQHQASDIMNCVKVMLERGNKVILGARDFSGENVPPKSRFGNKMTSFVFKAVCGINIRDTQTGLRAIPAEYLKAFCDIEGERFEYETNMLLELRHMHIGYEEVTIETVYIEENASTHFHPFRDSIKIYGVIFKFMAGSFASSGIDLGAFALFRWLFIKITDTKSAIFIATVLARVISSLFNYSFNRQAVFKDKGNVSSSIVRYYTLCVIQMLVSYGLVWTVTDRLKLGGILTIIAKAVIDTILFIISFQIQQRWVFNGERKETANGSKQEKQQRRD